eukprot:Em0018g517a
MIRKKRYGKSQEVDDVTHLAKTALEFCLMWCITICFSELILFVSLIFVGHITGDTVELDAAALAISFINVTATSVCQGLSTAAETLCSQAYGHKNFKKVGIILQRGILILVLVMLPVWGFWLNADSVLLVLHQPPCVAVLTGQYMKVICIALPFYFLAIIFSRYLESQSIMMPSFVSGFLCCVLAVTLHVVMIYGLKLGFMGAPIAMTITYIFSPLIMLVYLWKTKAYEKTWSGWSWDSLTGWWSFVRLGLPGLLVNCFEWWAGEIAIIIAGTIGKTDLALVAIFMNVLIFIFGPQYGIAVAATVRVGNELGAGHAKGAKRVAYICIACAVVSALIIALILECIRPFIGHVFTEDKEVLEGIHVIVHICAGSAIVDALQSTVTSVLKGCGRQFVSAVINFCCYYIIGIPVGAILALIFKMGALGLCIGLTCANTLQCITLCIVLMRINWNSEAERAKERCASEQSQDSESDTGTIQTDDSNEVGEGIVSTSETGSDETLTANGGESSEVHNVEDNTVFIINGNVCDQIPQLWCSQLKTNQRARLKHFLTKSTFFTFGFGILVASIVLSSQFQPPEIYTNSSYCYPSTLPEVNNASTSVIVTPSSTVNSFNDPQRITVTPSNTAFSPSSVMYSSIPVVYSPTPIAYSPTSVVLFPTPIMHSPVPHG